MILEHDRAKLCLFLDVDGTLIDIAERPEGVHVPTGLTDALRGAMNVLGGALALVSGRTIANLDTLFDPMHLSASGVHGAEMRYEPEGSIAVAEVDVLSDSLTDEIVRIASRHDGTIVENKRFSAAIHYRQSPSAGSMLHRELTRLVDANPDQGLRILPGHMVFELKRATFDKGIAIARFMARSPFLGRIPVFVGDDVTDEPGFEAVRERGGYAFGVGKDFPGTAGSFPDPASVRTWLAAFTASEIHHE